MIQINNSERVLFVGATGSGKTVLAKKLLSGLSRVIVIDPKHTFSLPGFELVKKYKMPWFNKQYKLIARPHRGDDEELNDLILSACRDGNLTIYVDELSSMVDFFPESVKTLGDIARTGRERLISLWMAFQRPRWIPKIFMTETESMFIFGLRSLEDRQYISGYIGPAALAELDRYNFTYARTDAHTQPETLTLNLGSGKITRTGKDVNG